LSPNGCQFDTHAIFFYIFLSCSDFLFKKTAGRDSRTCTDLVLSKNLNHYGKWLFLSTWNLFIYISWWFGTPNKFTQDPSLVITISSMLILNALMSIFKKLRFYKILSDWWSLYHPYYLNIYTFYHIFSMEVFFLGKFPMEVISHTQRYELARKKNSYTEISLKIIDIKLFSQILKVWDNIVRLTGYTSLRQIQVW